MGVKTIPEEFESSVSATRIYKAFCIDSHNFLPKVLPASVNMSVEFLQGDSSAPGSVKLTKYFAEGESKSVKNKIEEVDEEKLYYKYTITEGDMLGEKIEFIVVEVKIEAKSTGSCVHIISHFHTKEGVELDAEKLKSGKDKITKVFVLVDEHLKANPDVYA